MTSANPISLDTNSSVRRVVRRLQAEAELVHEPVDDLVRCAHDEDVVAAQDQVLCGLAPLDPKYGRAVGRAECGLDQLLPDEAGIGPYAQAELVLPEGIRGGEVRQVGGDVDRPLIRGPGRQDPAADERHVEDGHDQQRRADQGELEKGEGAQPRLLERLRDDDVGRRAGQREKTAGVRGERERHEVLGRYASDRPRRRHDGRQQRRDRAGVADERGQAGSADHDDNEQPDLGAARRLEEPLASPAGHAGPRQPFADDEQRRDHHDGRVAEPRERVARIDHAGKREREEREYCDQVRWPAPPNEQHDRDPQYDEGCGHLFCPVAVDTYPPRAK